MLPDEDDINPTIDNKKINPIFTLFLVLLIILIISIGLLNLF